MDISDEDVMNEQVDIARTKYKNTAHQDQNAANEDNNESMNENECTVNTDEDVTTIDSFIRESPNRNIALKKSVKEGDVHKCITNTSNVTMVVGETSQNNSTHQVKMNLFMKVKNMVALQPEVVLEQKSSSAMLLKQNRLQQVPKME